MAHLLPDSSRPFEIAFFDPSISGGRAKLHVQSATPVELWERIIPFAPPGSATIPPDFVRTIPFSGTQVDASFDAPTLGSIPLAGLYQARLFRFDSGNPKGIDETRVTGFGLEHTLLGKVDFPCLKPEARADFLTACGESPQIDLEGGGTFASLVFAASKRVMFHVQIGAVPPILSPGGPAFVPTPATVASATSVTPKRIHRAVAIDDLVESDITEHSPLLAGHRFFFVTLVWDSNGSWDFLWNTTGFASQHATQR